MLAFCSWARRARQPIVGPNVFLRPVKPFCTEPNRKMMSRVNQNILPQKGKKKEGTNHTARERKKKSQSKFQMLTTEYAQNKLHNFNFLQIHPASVHTVNTSSLCHGLMAHWTELQPELKTCPGSKSMNWMSSQDTGDLSGLQLHKTV